MHRLGIVLVLLGAFGCGQGERKRHAAELDRFLVERAQEVFPELQTTGGVWGGGGSDGDYSAQFDRRLDTQEPIAASKHAHVVSKLAADAQAWLDERGLAIRARGTTVGEDGAVERFMYRYEGKGAVGWVSVHGLRNEAGGFTLLLTVTEHVG